MIASLKRWGSKDQAGKALMGYVTDMPKVDNKTFKMILSEPYGMVLDTLGKTGTMVPVIMRAEDAAKSADEQIDSAIGSGAVHHAQGRVGPWQQNGLRQEPRLTSRARVRRRASPAARRPRSIGSNSPGSPIRKRRCKR